MAEVLNNVYSDVIEELLIIDCRYPYEYDGGHITVSRLLPSSAVECSRSKRDQRNADISYMCITCF